MQMSRLLWTRQSLCMLSHRKKEDTLKFEHRRYSKTEKRGLIQTLIGMKVIKIATNQPASCVPGHYTKLSYQKVKRKKARLNYTCKAKLPYRYNIYISQSIIFLLLQRYQVVTVLHSPPTHLFLRAPSTNPSPNPTPRTLRTLSHTPRTPLHPLHSTLSIPAQGSLSLKRPSLLVLAATLSTIDSFFR